MDYRQEAIRELRVQKGLSQAEFGKKVGIDQRQLSRYESGVNVPSMRNLTKIATALDVPVTIFFKH